MNKEKTLVEKVYEFLKRNTWGQGAYYSVISRCYCLAGAAAEVTGGITKKAGGVQFNDTGRLAEKAIAFDLGFRDTNAMIDWNDEKGRTISDVMEQLRRAILKQRRAA
jgi:hypothetical protein